MNRKQYEAMRKKLMDEAQSLIDAGKVEEANAKMEEIKKLDQQWDTIAQAMADFAALNGTQVPKQGNIRFEDSFGGEKAQETESPVVQAWKSEEYKNAWAKTLMGVPLNDSESEKFRMVNEAFTHTTKNTGVVIPETVAKGIWEMAGEYYPYFNESTKTEDGKETFKEYKLSGCELSRAITVSWKLKEMAIEDFIPYIQRKMAKKMGAAAGYGVTHGAGANAASGKPEPMGVVTALQAEEGKPQVVEYGDALTYEDIIHARAKIKSGYGAGLSVYANSVTIWTKLATVMDANKRPLFVADVTSGGLFRILGMPVKEDDSMQNGEILMSNAYSGYHMNINKEVSMMTEDHVKDRLTDYVGYGIMDGNIITSKAHALLTKKVSEASGTSEESGKSE